MREHLIRGTACAALLIGAQAGAWAADDWPQYRHDTARTGEQENHSALSDPAKVPSLAVRWQFPPAPGGVGHYFAAQDELRLEVCKRRNKWMATLVD